MSKLFRLDAATSSATAPFPKPNFFSANSPVSLVYPRLHVRASEQNRQTKMKISPLSGCDTFPSWVFDGSDIPDPLGHGERAVRALRALRHPLSTLPRQAFDLAPWQERVVRRIYGPRHPNGDRIVRKVVLLIPRGNRKTSFGAGLALLHTIGPERVVSSVRRE
nr:hypothetical protein [Acuticoccus yangtzensis]